MQYPVKKTREARLQLAQKIVEKLKERYENDLLAVAVFGSVARGEDKDFSDLDMIAVVQQGQGVADDFNAIVDGLKYAVDIFSQDIVLGKMTTVHMRWPFLAGKFVTAVPLYDKQGIFASYKGIFQKFIQNDFAPYVRQVFVEEIFEECNKFINTTDTGDRGRVHYNAYHLFTKLAIFLGIVNKTYFTSAVALPEQALKLPINFPSFQLLGSFVTGDASYDTQQLRNIVVELLCEIISYLRSSNIEFEVEEIIFKSM
ncbi:kanamycin nucleotidyltransferase C-terminal domain-containing protein [Ktedonospora formicarum]|uniref:Polymerase nucleotidyl transferase domain-containing protein n=1 Tax=Ktedonospora formicarum TaxID=2778364 RepID=A0A8J3MVS0_9CHLR|nr:kanamycin nucleotidyltransferase C-terminal domain-containing protein [Ktedonospora formicarum]GHO47938.1 hypothetical protein KSX_61010 [Ktedonospora formicarum]